MCILLNYELLFVSLWPKAVGLDERHVYKIFSD